MTAITRETIIRDALFLVGESDNSYSGALKDKYDRTFDLIRRTLIADHQLASTLRMDAILNTAGEQDWYLLPVDLCQYFTIPSGIRAREVTILAMLEYRTEIRVVGGKISYYADTDFYETLPPPFINLLSLKFKESISLLVIETKPQLTQIFSQKIKEAITDLNAYKNTSQKNSISITNIPLFGFGDTQPYGVYT